MWVVFYLVWFGVGGLSGRWVCLFYCEFVVWCFDVWVCCGFGCVGICGGALVWFWFVFVLFVLSFDVGF